MCDCQVNVPSSSPRSAVRVRVGGGYRYVYQPDSRAPATTPMEHDVLSMRMLVSEKEQKILRLQTKLSSAKERVTELEDAMSAAAGAHALELAALRRRVEEAECALKGAASQSDGKQQLQPKPQRQVTSPDTADCGAASLEADLRGQLGDEREESTPAAEVLAFPERQQVQDMHISSELQEELMRRAVRWQERALNAEAALADFRTHFAQHHNTLHESSVRPSDKRSVTSASPNYAKLATAQPNAASCPCHLHPVLIGESEPSSDGVHSAPSASGAQTTTASIDALVKERDKLLNALHDR